MLSAIFETFNKVATAVSIDPVVRAIRIEEFIAAQLEAIAEKMPENPVLRGYKVFSQVDEDGIIEAISARLPETARNGRFIEIGCSNGLQNNTHYLALKGYRGVWVDGAQRLIDRIHREIPATKSGLHLLAECHFVDATSIGELLIRYSTFLGTAEPEFFSLDIDGNDAIVVEAALKVIRPAVVCVEYNAKFGPELEIAIARDDRHTWKGDDYFGASLARFVKGLPGYRLVSCSIAGINAFFVREDLAGDFPSYSTTELFRPSLYELVKRAGGHPPSLRWLRNVISDSGIT